MTLGLHPTHLRRLVVRPTLDWIELGGPVAEDLMVGTALTESAGLRYLKQGLRRVSDARGTALGLWGTEPRTHDDLWQNFLPRHPWLCAKVGALSVLRRAEDLVWDLRYACAVARLVYYRRPEPLPAGDAASLARYHEVHYNTRLGAAGRTPDVLEHLHWFEMVVPGGEFGELDVRHQREED